MLPPGEKEFDTADLMIFFKMLLQYFLGHCQIPSGDKEKGIFYFMILIRVTFISTFLT